MNTSVEGQHCQFTTRKQTSNWAASLLEAHNFLSGHRFFNNTHISSLHR